MQLAMCLADTTGTTNMLSLVSSKRCKVGYVNAEDPELILKYRIKNIATKNIFASVCITDKYNAQAENKSILKALDENLDIVSVAGKQFNLMSKTFGSVTPNDH